MAFDDNKTRTWDRTTLNDGLYFEDEFSRVYGNLTDVDGRVVNLGDSLSALTNYAYTLIAGTIQGGVYWDKTGGGIGAMVVRGGRYEVLGKIITLNGDVTLSPVTHCYGNDVLEDDRWYYTLIDSAGTLRCQPATGTALHTGLEVNSVTDQGGGAFQVTFRNSPDLSILSAGMLFRSDDLGGGNSGIFNITSVDAAAFKVIVANNRGTTMMAGTEPVGTGALYAAVPYVNSPKPTFDISRQGYYDGELRILGIDYYESTRTHRWVRSYRSGFDRNDNEIVLLGFQGTTNGYVIQYEEYIRLWGHDYTFEDTNGTEITPLRAGTVSGSMSGYTESSSGLVRGFTINATPAQTAGQIHSLLDPLVVPIFNNGPPAYVNGVHYTGKLEAGSVLRPMTNGGVPHGPDNDQLVIHFTPE